MNASQSPSVRFANGEFPRRRHVCAFFRSPAEQYRVLGPFIKEGIECGDKGFHLIDPAFRGEHLRRLKSVGIDGESAVQAGRLEICCWEDTYLRGGRFDQKAMLSLIDDLLGAKKDRAFGLTRIVANMEWALKDLPGVEDLIEYESRVNDVLQQYDDPAV